VPADVPRSLRARRRRDYCGRLWMNCHKFVAKDTLRNLPLTATIVAGGGWNFPAPGGCWTAPNIRPATGGAAAKQESAWLRQLEEPTDLQRVDLGRTARRRNTTQPSNVERRRLVFAPSRMQPAPLARPTTRDCNSAGLKPQSRPTRSGAAVGRRPHPLTHASLRFKPVSPTSGGGRGAQPRGPAYRTRSRHRGLRPSIHAEHR
jgi:hypothetical protein